MDTVIVAERYHDISCGHRVVGHESKCCRLHGHNYRIHFTLEACLNGLDEVGRVIDFGVIKASFCEWLEERWDHRFLLWERDPLLYDLNEAVLKQRSNAGVDELNGTLVAVPFNPTAENMAIYLLEVIGPQLLLERQLQFVCKLCSVRVQETAKCGAVATSRIR